MSRQKFDWSNEAELRKRISAAKSMSDVLRSMDLIPASNAKTFRKYVDKYGIDTSHFDPLANRVRRTRQPVSEILVENSKYPTYHLKHRLLKSGILNEVCDECGLSNVWNGKQISLHLDHINGDSTDNRLENLRMLCPNCHSQTETYAGRNKKHS